MATQNCLHQIKLEELTFQMSQERSCAINGTATASLANLRGTYTQALHYDINEGRQACNDGSWVHTK